MSLISKSARVLANHRPHSELLGHSNVQTTLSVYQHVETDQFRAPLNEIATELLPDVTKLAASRAWKEPDVLKRKELVIGEDSNL